MDEKRLRTRLIRLYVTTTAIVLAVVLATILFLSLRNARREKEQLFSTLLASVVEKLQIEGAVRHSWLRQYERDYSLLVRIIDNGRLLIYNQGDDALRRKLFDEIQARALDGGMDVTAAPLYTQRRNSPIYTFKEEGRNYYGAASVMPVESGYCALVMAQNVGPPLSARSFAIYFLCYAASVTALTVIGTFSIDKALLPAMESRKRQTEFIAAASHELRAPLTVIQANAATISHIPDQIPEATAAIENECTRMSRLIGDMLLLASTDAKNWPISLATLDMDTLLIGVYEAYTPVCERRGFRLDLSLPEEPLPKIKGDAERLTQVLGVLIDNALSYGGAADQSIEIKARRKKNLLEVQVIDHGVGIPDDVKAYVFERFHRNDRSRKDKQHFGLGLAIAHELVTLHGGHISLSDTDGGGCTFGISLPCHSSTSQS